MTADVQLAVAPTGIVDVSLPPTAGARTRMAAVLADVGLTLLLVLMLPVVFIVGAPLVFVAWVIVVIAQARQGSSGAPPAGARHGGSHRKELS